MGEEIGRRGVVRIDARNPAPVPMDEITPDRLVMVVRSAGDGDEAAWRTLVEVYSPRVFALVRAQCRDEELAEEITQSTFCTIATKLADYDEVGRFESWLMRIAMNRLRDEMRRRKRLAWCRRCGQGCRPWI